MGKVFLIGAGPGDPELMTLKAVRALGSADVVLIDDLVNDAKIINVGKRGGCRSTPQRFIEKLLVRYARQGRTIARLKGGDPFVFGRGGEEMQALRAAGVDVDVIPGITAGIGAAAALGIPVTHRSIAHGVTFVTGHTGDAAEPDWTALARSGMTLVIYMGLSRLDWIAAQLRHAGMPADMPACVIENGTLESQRQHVTTLGLLSAEGFASPVIVVIGEVVRFAHVAVAALRARAA